MKIVINARLLNERKGGPYRYLVNILSELALIDKKNEYILLLNAKPEINYSFLHNTNFYTVIFPLRIKLLFDYIFIPFYSYFKKSDIFFFPKNTFSPLIKGKKIAVYHDIVYYEKLNFREFKFFDNLHHKIMIRFDSKLTSADLAVSKFTAQRMEQLLKIHSEKIKVIYEGVEDSFKIVTDNNQKEQLKSRYNLPDHFLFFAGSLSPRKNIINILKAFEMIKDSIPHNIYFTASESWNDSQVYNYIKSHNLENRIIRLGYLSEEGLVIMYNLADCYLYPSLYEGFGLPIIEAQKCGCPVITSNRSSCPEIAGDGALIVDPYSIHEIAEAILKVVNDQKFKKELIKKGIENIKRFSWERAAKEHLKLFEKVAQP